MKKTYLAGLVVFAIIALGIVAVPKTMAEKQIKEDRSVTIDGATPEHPVVSLGKAFDKKSGKEVEGYAIVHYSKGSGNFAKPTPTPTPTVCYGFLAQGAKWTSVEPWTVDSINTGGINSSLELGILDQSIAKWEDATDGLADGIQGYDILGQGDTGVISNPRALGKTIDGKNEVTFAPIRSRGAIAVTYIWGNFSSTDINSRYLAEWDQIYNTAYVWSDSSEAGKMDFENIATHELGHAVGMADLYNSGCNQETMFGYADNGQTNKRDLNAGDIAGIGLLY